MAMAGRPLLLLHSMSNCCHHAKQVGAHMGAPHPCTPPMYCHPSMACCLCMGMGANPKRCQTTAKDTEAGHLLGSSSSINHMGMAEGPLFSSPCAGMERGQMCNRQHSQLGSCLVQVG